MAESANRLGGPRLRVLAAVPIIALGMHLLSAPASAKCVGDCDGNGAVAINELIKGVNIALGNLPVTECEAMDANGDGNVAINELIQAVNRALGECPISPTPTPTVKEDTPTATPTFVSLTPCHLAEGSQLLLNTQAFPLGPVALGDISISCGEIEDGTAACTCDIIEFEPLAIPGVGFVCIYPSSGCPVGRIDCDGGSNLGIDLIADRNIGPCTGNDDCVGQCQGYCDAIGKVPTLSGFGCEGFCEGGDRDGLECECDTADPGDPSCALDCPAGSCNGKDGVAAGHICECQCVDQAAFGPDPAGTLQCNLGASLFVESAAPCSGDDVIITVGERCIGLTTGTASSVIFNANSPSQVCSESSHLSCVAGECAVPGESCVPVTIGPLARSGSGLSCDELPDGSPSGLALRGVVNFFGSTLGDILTELVLNCE